MLPLNASARAVAHAVTSAMQLMNCHQKETPPPPNSYDITATEDKPVVGEEWEKGATGRTLETSEEGKNPET